MKWFFQFILHDNVVRIASKVGTVLISTGDKAQPTNCGECLVTFFFLKLQSNNK